MFGLLCNSFAVADFGTIIVTSLWIFVYLAHDPLNIGWFVFFATSISA